MPITKSIAKHWLGYALENLNQQQVTFVNNVSLYDWFEIYVVVSFELQRKNRYPHGQLLLLCCGVKIKDTN